MAKYAGTQFNVFLVDGYNLAPSLSEAVTMGKESITQQTNAFNATSEEHTPLNLEKGVLSVGNGFFDAVTDPIHGAVGSSQGISRIVCAAIEDNIIGRHFMGFQGAIDSKFELLDSRDGLVRANVTYLISGNVEEGIIVQHLTAYTADWDTKTGGAGAPDSPLDFTIDPQNRVMEIASNSMANPTIVTMKTFNGNPIPHGLTSTDLVFFSGSNSTPTLNGSRVATVISPTTFSVPVNVSVAGTLGSFVRENSNAGGVGYLQVTAYSGFTVCLNRIMHSANDSAYAALVSFADLGVTYLPTKARIAVVGTVDRYLASFGDVTGSGSVTVFMGFCRN